jgi:CheY-like chemotaxis protein
MLANLLQAAWVVGVIGSVALLIYGGWLVWQFQQNASIANQRTVAHSALHDWLPTDELLDQVKKAALGFEKANGFSDSQGLQSRLATAVRGVRSNLKASRHVLVVEDNLDAVHSTVTLIKMMGHECQFAINGFSALEIARQFRPDIILLDLSLPDLKGYDIARQLKWEPGLEATRIIALTALPDEDRQRAIDAGCNEFYRKPLDPMVLEQLLKKPLSFGERAAA